MVNRVLLALNNLGFLVGINISRHFTGIRIFVVARPTAKQAAGAFL